ncbi:MAG: tRNA modification GTPase [Bacteroidia bacterium]|jgi:tRNA modification GTPase
MYNTDTIAAIATPTGRGGVGIIRISGPQCLEIVNPLLKNKKLKPRQAHFSQFYNTSNDKDQMIDSGIVLYFPAPHSFTGEDVVELQGHGGPVILNMLLREIFRLGARQAKPGEFSERAFLNDKIDLAQAEAIADLIDSASEQAAKNAVRSLEGEFSRRVNALVAGLIHLRIYVEAAIDFPEEEVDFLSDGKVQSGLNTLSDDMEELLNSAQQGALLREGMNVVIAGKPNAGKSSLLNALAGRESAIVTNIAGTTRDILRETILIEGMPLHVVDTAGLRDSEDTVEQEGIRRAWSAIDDADRILLVVDSTDQHSADDMIAQVTKHKSKLTVIYNKSDLSGLPIGLSSDGHSLQLSAKAGEGIDELREHLKDCIGYHGGSDSQFTARQRHVDALQLARKHFAMGREQLELYRAGELLAEELRLSQNALSSITGEFTSDDLLGKIFSSFCIGK